MSTPPRLEGERPLFDLTGHPVDLDGKHYLDSLSGQRRDGSDDRLERDRHVHYSQLYQGRDMGYGCHQPERHVGRTHELLHRPREFDREMTEKGATGNSLFLKIKNRSAGGGSACYTAFWVKTW